MVYSAYTQGWKNGWMGLMPLAGHTCSLGLHHDHFVILNIVSESARTIVWYTVLIPWEDGLMSLAGHTCSLGLHHGHFVILNYRGSPH